jgi:hypothetical protein
MNADVERAINWLKGMADDRGYIEHLAHGGKGDPIEEQEIECASTALKYIESLQAQLAKEKRRAERAVNDLNTLRKKSGKWISVTEQLPEPEKTVLILQSFTETGEPTHWMPLPQPPKE